MTACTAEDRFLNSDQSAPHYPWYAVRVRSNFEKATAAALHGRGLEEYVPLYRKRTKWCDRVTTLEVPLFPGYLFCRINIQNRLPVLSTPGVVTIVRFGDQFLPIPDPEVDAIRLAQSSGATILPWPYLRVGQRVRIEQGAMTGVEGILVRIKDDYRLVLSVDILMRSVAVHLDRDSVRPIN
ncbi:MAG: UpxY family transcription antiterminator [Acidobacteria bacterium]|nr:UpxY family transcription antiterminator [Acidobacteriota bacterium]